MKKKSKKLYSQQKKRYLKKIIGSPERPRLSVFRSHKHIYAQLIDDKNSVTIVASSTLQKNLELIESTGTKKSSFKIGQDIAEKALSKNITTIIFDRGRRPYHGRIQSLAEGARDKGLIF